MQTKANKSGASKQPNSQAVFYFQQLSHFLTSNSRYLKSSTNNTQFEGVQWGLGSLGDTVGAGDYDGDGKTDVAVWRSSTGIYYVLKSSDGGTISFPFGGSSFADVPVPADYDGDRKTDYTIWRAPTGFWWVQRSSDNTAFSIQFGSQAAGDKLAPAAFIPTGAIVGSITNANANPPNNFISGARLEVYEQNVFKTSVVTDSNGYFTATGLLTGVYEVKARATDYKDAILTGISVVAGSTTTCNVNLSPEREKIYSDEFTNSLGSFWNIGLLPNGTPYQDIQVRSANNTLEIETPRLNVFNQSDKFRGVVTPTPKNFTDSSIIVKVVDYAVGQDNPNNLPPPDQRAAYNPETRIEIGSDDTHKYIIKIGTEIYRKNGDNPPVLIKSFFHGSVNHAYHRIRHSTSDGRIHFETSPTGIEGTWVEQHSDASIPFSLADTFVSLNAGTTNRTCSYTNINQCSNIKSHFDDFKFVKNSTTSANAGDDQIITVGNNTTLNGTAQGGNSYKWTFLSKPAGAPDPNISDSTILNPIISNLTFIGDYNFRLTVSNTNNSNDSSSDTIRIRVVDNPVARIIAPTTVKAGEPIVFDGSTSSGAYEYEWDFGDGRKAEIARATHLYMSASQTPYTVSLKVKNEAGAVSSVVTTTVTVSGLETPVIVPVGCGGDLQAAINNASGRTDIVLPNGCVYGPITLPNRTTSANDYIVIRSEGAPQFSIGVRVSKDNPADIAKMAYIETGTTANSSAVITQSPSGQDTPHHFYFNGIFFRRKSGNVSLVTNLVGLGSGISNPTLIPHHIIFDHCIFENTKNGTTTYNMRRGISLDSSYSTVMNSGIYNMREIGADSQAILGSDTTGQHAIVNNYLEAATENIMYGGSDTVIINGTPADIVVRNNYLFKPLSWRNETCPPGEPCWNIKNIFELKNVKNVILDGNVLENCWPDGQAGFGVLLTVRNQDGGNPWATIQNVQMTNNKMINVASGIQILGIDYNYPSVLAHNLIIRNNLMDKVGATALPGQFVRLLLIQSPNRKIWITHNTMIHTTETALLGDGQPTITNNSEFRFNDNILKFGTGFIGSVTPYDRGIDFLDGYFPGWIMRRNVMFFSNPSGSPSIPDAYPGPNLCRDENPSPPANANCYRIAGPTAGSETTFQNQFIDFANGNFRLQSNSLGIGYATDGSDVGSNHCQISTLANKATSGVWDTNAPTPICP